MHNVRRNETIFCTFSWFHYLFISLFLTEGDVCGMLETRREREISRLALAVYSGFRVHALVIYISPRNTVYLLREGGRKKRRHPLWRFSRKRRAELSWETSFSRGLAITTDSTYANCTFPARAPVLPRRRGLRAMLLVSAVPSLIVSRKFARHVRKVGCAPYNFELFFSFFKIPLNNAQQIRWNCVNSFVICRCSA